MSDTMVKSYTDKELLNRCKSLGSFVGFPKGFWLLGVQSEEDSYDKFDDKFYLFKGTKFIMVTTGTTNAGSTGLHNYQRYNSEGVAVIKTDEWYYDLWGYGLHRGRMKALRQKSPIKFFRDWNRNNKAEQIGEMKEGIIYANFHTVSYSKKANFIRRLIGGWSVACQVLNNVAHYYKIIDLVKYQRRVSYCLIKEF